MGIKRLDPSVNTVNSELIRRQGLFCITWIFLELCTTQICKM